MGKRNCPRWQGDAFPGETAPPGTIVANGYATSSNLEDRKPLEPGEMSCCVWLEIRHPAISAGPDDNLDDLKVF
jgi:hypothetical protein